MSVKKEASGRRSVQVEVEVPGTPEEVWQAIATGPGISSWLVPAEFEEQRREARRGEDELRPGHGVRSAVTAWEPPRMCAAESDGGVPGSPPIANEWSVEARGGGVCIVRVVQSLFASTDDWDNQLEGGECRHGLRSSAPCGSISRTSAANARRSCSWWSLSRGRKRRPGKR